MPRPLLSLHALTLAFGGESVLQDVSLNLTSGMRACITGRNGEGKSTLLKVIAGLIEPDAGEIVRASQLRVSYLAQEVPSDRPGTVREIARSEKYITQLGLDAQASFNTLSGGLRRRVLLAQALADEPDLVLLDEPTNHLDIDSIAWLEKFMRRPSETTFLFVTHDRAFLREVATYVIDLDRGVLSGWACSWRTFLQRKADLQANEEVLWQRKAKKLAQEEAWIRQGVKARRTRNQGRVEALRQLRLEFAARRVAQGTASLTLASSMPSGTRVIKLDHVSFQWPGTSRMLIHDFSATLLRGERIGVVGANGAGKTTLLKLLTGQLKPTSGTISWGTNLEMAFFDQLHAQLDGPMTVKESVAKDCDVVQVGGVQKHVYAYLSDFLFTPERARTPVKALSGGEKARLLLARLFLKPSNLLIMDEPTNDLDLETLELLEEQLANYAGTLLVVSHDRAFLDNVVTSTFVLGGDGEVHLVAGGSEEALRCLHRIQQESRARVTPSVKESSCDGSASKVPTSPKKLSYSETRLLDQLPAQMERLEQEIAQLEKALSDPTLFARTPEKGADQVARLAQAREELDQAETRWLELSERAD